MLIFRVCRFQSVVKPPRIRTTLPTSEPPSNADLGIVGSGRWSVALIVTFPSGVSSLISVSESAMTTP